METPQRRCEAVEPCDPDFAAAVERSMLGEDDYVIPDEWRLEHVRPTPPPGWVALSPFTVQEERELLRSWGMGEMLPEGTDEAA